MLGKQLLDVITSGMYSDPRMAIREYIQNAADSIDKAREQGFYGADSPRIRITLDGRERIITVEDNGSGISGRNVEVQLGSLGCSPKSGNGQRGFRGIGRLGGLTYCDLLRFETRQREREPVHVVEWNGQALREQVTVHKSDRELLTDAIQRIAFVSKRPADPSLDPQRFFRVHMIDVHRFHADLLMNVKGLREYLSQTAPVSYKTDEFPFASQIEKYMSEIPGYCSYDITLNGSDVMRPYRVHIDAPEHISDQIQDIEFVECISRQRRLLCRGWYAKTSFLSALPQHMTMRGIRVRQGNIAVGDEYFLKDLFSESRFATWHVGELHVTPLLKLNARRDGFEESEEYEEFLEWASVLCRRLSSLARQSSKERSARLSIDRQVSDFRQELSIPFFIDEAHARLFVDTAEQQLERLRKLLPKSADGQQVLESCGARLSKLRKHPILMQDILDGRVLHGKDNRGLLIDVCKRILFNNHAPNTLRIILEIVRPYMKNKKSYAVE